MGLLALALVSVTGMCVRVYLHVYSTSLPIILRLALLRNGNDGHDDGNGGGGL